MKDRAGAGAGAGAGRFHIDEQAFLRLVRGQTKGPLASLARGGLGLASMGYGLGVAARGFALKTGLFKTNRAAVPVVSVGNLTLGGTGKTPMVEWIARWWRDRGVRVAVLSRGYGATSGVNDEARVLEENLPDVPHLQDGDRSRIARIACEELESELLILDDGFQHRRLARDLDVVLLDALDPFGLNHLFPRGLLREPIRALRRAHVIILSRADLIDNLTRESIRRRVDRATRGPAICWAEARHLPLELTNSEGSVRSLDHLRSVRAGAFCGIGNPEAFRRTLVQLVPGAVDLRVFPDHHPYTAADVANLIGWAKSLQAELILTTQKDLVKLRIAGLGSTPLWALRIGLEVTTGRSEFENALANLLPLQSRPTP